MLSAGANLGGLVTDMVALLRRYRLPLVVGFDVVAWLTAYVVFAWLRFDAVAA